MNNRCGAKNIEYRTIGDRTVFNLLLVIIYLAFISLGLPDSMLGAAWPNMYVEFDVPLSYAGIVSAIIIACTIIVSLQSDRIIMKLGAGKVTAVSVSMTALALFGFSISHSLWMICLFAIPYGLGGGGVDAALNNYVALHYESRHMSWLHCMWGVGAATGPYVMGYAMTNGAGWNGGYRIIAIMQIVLSVVLFLSLPLWKNQKDAKKEDEHASRAPMSIRDVLRIKGAKEVLICFFCYCAIEQTAGLWASTYLNLHKGIPVERAASFASMFYIGITVGRAFSGFLTMKFSDKKMIRLGLGGILTGIIIMMLPANVYVSLVGLILVGIGCAPVYPCIIHSTPAHFGEDKSQAVIGVQMAFAYVGILCMPPLFGIIANNINVSLLPIYLLIVLIVMIVMNEKLNNKCN